MIINNHDENLFVRERLKVYLKSLEEANNIYAFLIERYNLDIKLNNLDSRIMNNICGLSISKTADVSILNIELKVPTTYKEKSYNIEVPIELFYREIDEAFLKEKIKNHIRNIHVDILNKYKNSCIDKMRQQIEHIEATDKLIQDLNI